MKKIILMLFAALGIAGKAIAVVIPAAVPGESQIRVAQYKPRTVYQLETVTGKSTAISFEDGEKYVTHWFGDGAAWIFGFKASVASIKPTDERPDTNLTIITNMDGKQRRYYFVIKNKDDFNQEGMLGVEFEYPETVAKVAEVEQKKKTIERNLATMPAAKNTRYTMSGDEDIAPINAWDDGTFTYFQFAPNTDIPDIKFVDMEGNESRVARGATEFQSELVVVQKVNPKWILRLANRALAVYNEAYDADGGIANTTGTTSNRVVRVIKKGP